MLAAAPAVTQDTKVMAVSIRTQPTAGRAASFIIGGRCSESEAFPNIEVLVNAAFLSRGRRRSHGDPQS